MCIRDRGYNHVIVRGKDFEQQLRNALDNRPLELVMDSVGAVSYTHLTLPTSDLV